MLEEQFDEVVLLLLVLVDDDDGLLVVGHLLVNHGCGVLHQFDAREEFLDLGLGAVNIHITNYNDGLVVGTIPFLVVVAQHFGLEVVNYLHKTDWHTATVLAARIEVLEISFQHTHHGTCAHTPLLVDHTTLFVDFLGIEGKTIRPVFQDEQTGVEGACACRRNIADTVNRLVNSGIGIEVRTKLYTDGTQILNQAVVWIVVRAIESHVFQEVSQASLVFILLNGTHTLCDVEVYSVLGITVVADVISKAIAQLANPYVLIHWNGRHLHFLRHYANSVYQQ